MSFALIRAVKGTVLRGDRLCLIAQASLHSGLQLTAAISRAMSYEPINHPATQAMAASRDDRLVGDAGRGLRDPFEAGPVDGGDQAGASNPQRDQLPAFRLCGPVFAAYRIRRGPDSRVHLQSGSPAAIAAVEARRGPGCV